MSLMNLPIVCILDFDERILEVLKWWDWNIVQVSGWSGSSNRRQCMLHSGQYLGL